MAAASSQPRSGYPLRMKFETKAVHAGAHIDEETGAVAPSIQLSTTFERNPADGRPSHGFAYIRDGNPNNSRLEEALAAIDSARAALAFASGMAAVSALMQSLPAGAQVLIPDDSYYGVRELVLQFLPRWGMSGTPVDMADLGAVERAMTVGTRAIWCESPSNPLMKVVDLAALAALARRHGALLAVDNTFATPALQRPIELGAGVVMHSTTKYLGGHSDVQGGSLAFAEAGDLWQAALHARTITGGVAAPFNSWLILRGIRSLPARMRVHCANAMAVARFLEGHPRVEVVHYPGLPSHANHDVAARQMSDFGGMLSFRVKGGREEALAVAAKVRLFTRATSLGGTESLIEHRNSSEGPGSRTPVNLLRCSVGLEAAEDLVEDLRQALGD
jgi:cystathionine gamma-synthase